jgi:hypothetical protein
MYLIKCFYIAYETVNGIEIRIQKSFEHQAYCCPKCEEHLEFVEADVGRSLISCECGYGYWVDPQGKREDVD